MDMKTLSFFYTPTISLLSISAINTIELLKNIDSGVKLAGSITISVGTIIHLIFKIRNEIRKNRINNHLKK
jgi:hypothetical protein